MEKFQELLGNRYANFDKLNSIEKTTYVLRSELWESWRYANRNCTVITHALINFSPWLRIRSWLELRGKGMVSYVPR